MPRLTATIESPQSTSIRRVLPWQACPGAAAGAQRLVGVDLDDLAARVRSDLVGATTCTHLNSTLRTLANVRALAQSLQG